MAGVVLAGSVTTIGGGQPIIGGVTSFTVMICWHDAVLPQRSVAVYVLVNVNLFAHVMLVITSILVIITVPGQLSVAIAPPGGGTMLAQETVVLPGQTIIGGVLSSTVTIHVHVAVLSQSSVNDMV
jgi:hypothetical protein